MPKVPQDEEQVTFALLEEKTIIEKREEFTHSPARGPLPSVHTGIEEPDGDEPEDGEQVKHRHSLSLVHFALVHSPGKVLIFEQRVLESPAQAFLMLFVFENQAV